MHHIALIYLLKHNQLKSDLCTKIFWFLVFIIIFKYPRIYFTLNEKIYFILFYTVWIIIFEAVWPNLDLFKGSSLNHVRLERGEGGLIRVTKYHKEEEGGSSKISHTLKKIRFFLILKVQVMLGGGGK